MLVLSCCCYFGSVAAGDASERSPPFDFRSYFRPRSLAALPFTHSRLNKGCPKSGDAKIEHWAISCFCRPWHFLGCPVGVLGTWPQPEVGQDAWLDFRSFFLQKEQQEESQRKEDSRREKQRQKESQDCQRFQMKSSKTLLRPKVFTYTYCFYVCFPCRFFIHFGMKSSWRSNTVKSGNGRMSDWRSWWSESGVGWSCWISFWVLLGKEERLLTLDREKWLLLHKAVINGFHFEIATTYVHFCCYNFFGILYSA